MKRREIPLQIRLQSKREEATNYNYPTRETKANDKKVYINL